MVFIVFIVETSNNCHFWPRGISLFASKKLNYSENNDKLYSLF